MTFVKDSKNYTLAGKSCHLRTKKHIKNERLYIEERDIDLVIQMTGVSRDDVFGALGNKDCDIVNSIMEINDLHGENII